MKQENVRWAFRAFIFCFLTLICILILNAIYFKFVLQKQQVFRKEALYQEYIKSLPTKKIKYAFFGDSHTRNAINPKYVADSYNFSGSGENYIKSYFKLKKILEVDKVKVQNVVLEVDMHTFSTLFTDKDRLFDELYYYSTFVPFSEIAEIRHESILKLWIEATFPSFGRGEDFLNVFVKPDLTEIDRGWTRAMENYALADRDADARASESLHFDGQRRISDVSFDYFLRTLELAKQNNIAVHFVMYPLSAEYDREMRMHGIVRDEYYQTIFAQVKQKLGDSYKMLNYYDLFFTHPEYFANADHLNATGAEILSRKVLRDLGGATPVQ